MIFLKIIKKLSISLFIISVLILLLFFLLIYGINSDTGINYISSKIRQKLTDISPDFNVKFKNPKLTYSSQISLETISLIYKYNQLFLLKNCKISGLLNGFIDYKQGVTFQCNQGKLDLNSLIQNFNKTKQNINEEQLQDNTDNNIRQKILSKLPHRFNLKLKKLLVDFKNYTEQVELNLLKIGYESNMQIKLFDNLFLTIQNSGLKLDEFNLKLNGGFPKKITEYFHTYVNDNWTFSVDTSIKVNEELISVLVQDLKFNNLVINHSLIDKNPVILVDSGCKGSFTFNQNSYLVEFDRFELFWQNVKVFIAGTYQRGKYDFSVKNHIFNPYEISKLFADSKMDNYNLHGKIRFDFSINGDLKLKNKVLDVSFKSSISNLVQRSKRLNYLKEPFSYTYKKQSGELINVFIGEGNSDFVSISKIPRFVVGSVIVSEDIGFFTHYGLEPLEIERALKDNLLNKKNKYLISGSTITQQVVKTFLLSHEKSIARKVKEALLALELEATLTKERILEIYLNGIEWGPDFFGISNAARHYFDKTVTDLSLREAVYLACIIPNPIKYYTHYEENKIPAKWVTKINKIMSRMYNYKFISEMEFLDNIDKKIVFYKE